MSSHSTLTGTTGREDPAPAAQYRSGRRALAFVGMSWVSIAFVAASAAPSPLYVLYQAEWHFSSWLLTLAFSVYAFTLLIALLFAGSLSDYLGRRPVLLGAITLELIALAGLLWAGDVEWVILARALQGFATGVATASVSAALTDLSPPSNRQLGATVASVTPLAGLTVGALTAGIVIQATQTPIRNVFAGLIVALVVGGAFVLVSPETVGYSRGAAASIVPRLAIPRASRPAFIASSFLNVAVWLTTSFVLGLLPQIDRTAFGVSSGLANGGIVALLTASGATAVVVSRNLAPRRSALVAATALASGAVIDAIAIFSGHLGLFIAGSVVAGAGVGVGFGGYIRLVMQTADARHRSGLFSAMYVVSYLTFGLPVIVAGLLASTFTTPAVAIAYCALTVVFSALGLVSINRYSQRRRA
ncbi:MFS transporter [Gryllotalpicola protaetiae]|uniref:MFS transporter n=1 Tax=Gryllotalpicola protaetiae TaxID=2419771 RepID=UPI0013C47EB2|nr:MFS transporter [Gryllotalpicola protaetiae]